jgi:hypothetical protein
MKKSQLKSFLLALIHTEQPSATSVAWSRELGLSVVYGDGKEMWAEDFVPNSPTRQLICKIDGALWKTTVRAWV